MSKADPIRDNYFRALEAADAWSDRLFYAAAAVSLGALLVDEKANPGVFLTVQLVLLALTVGMFGLGLATRLYFMPRAEDMRRKEFIGSAFKIGLTHQKTDGYYNNDLVKPLQRIAAQLLENAHFTKAITREMAFKERIIVGVYALLWLALLGHRGTGIGLILIASQLLLSEQIISKVLRLEWLRCKAEKVFGDVYRMFQMNPSQEKFNASVLEFLGDYEAAKVNASVLLDNKVFEKRNAQLSSEWEQIKVVLNLKGAAVSTN